MDALLKFRVLGPLEVVAADQPVRIGAGKQRVILAALLLRANRTVSVDELIDDLWDTATRGDARGALQKYVMRLRRLLAAAAATAADAADDATDDLIRTEPDGYRIVLSPGQLDLDGFEALTADAARAASTGDAVGESALLAQAQRLWRGVPPLSDVPSVSLHRHEVAALTERYLQTLDRRIDLDLAIGRHAELVAELTGLVRRYPGRERFWANLMRSLHGAGRQGEALGAYREVARMLVEELGVDPGPELRAAHREILGEAPTGRSRPSDRPGPSTPARLEQTPPVWRPVRQLPRATAGFVGRAAELEWVARALEEGGPQSGAPVVITGLAGIGKSALAVQAAHRAADRFPDGQLYADLRCHASADPRTASEVLGGFLRALGMPADAIPAGAEDRSLAYRSLLAGRRVLVLLDDVADPAQVRLLLPGTTGCAVLVTSRDDLAGLAVRPGVRRTTLGTLSTGEGHDVLAELLGAREVDPGAAATDELLEVCGGLPLAIRVAAAHLMTHPETSIADYVAQLRGDDPIAALAVAGDALADLSSAFDASYRLLQPEHKRFLHALCRLPGANFTIPAAASAAEIADSCAAAAIEVLAAGSLLEPLAAQRYRMHELVRGYARRRSAEGCPIGEVDTPTRAGRVPKAPSRGGDRRFGGTAASPGRPAVDDRAEGLAIDAVALLPG